MPKVKLFITDERMLQLKDIAIQKGIADTESEYFELIGFQRTNMSNLRKGLQGFRKEHILAAAKLTGANINWLFGLEGKIMRVAEADPIKRLKDAVAAVEIELKAAANKRR